MATSSGQKKLTRGEKWLLVAPLFVLLLFGLTSYRTKIFPQWFPRTFYFSNSPIEFMRVSPDGKQLVVVSRDLVKPSLFSEHLTAWNIESGQIVWTFPFKAQLRDVNFSADGKYFSLVRNDSPVNSAPLISTLELRNTQSGQPLWIVRGFGFFDASVFSRDATSIITQGDSIEVRDIATGKLRRKVNARSKILSQRLSVTEHENSIMMVRNLETQPPRFQVQKWDLQDGRKKGNFPPTDTSWADFSTKRNELVTVGFPQDTGILKGATPYKGLTQIWDYSTGKLLRTLPKVDTTSDRTWAHCLTKNGDLLFRLRTGNRASQQAEMINLQSGKTLWTQSLPGVPASSQFSSDESLIGTSGRDANRSWGPGSVCLWEAANGFLIRTWKTEDTSSPVIFTNDSQYLIYFDLNKIYLWNIKGYLKGKTNG